MTLELDDVHIFLEEKEIVRSLSITVARGSVQTIMGPSGCGKSTLLSAVCGNLDDVFELKGDIRLNGDSVKDVPMESRKIGILFQEDLLFPHMDIGSNLAFAVPGKVSRKDRLTRVKEVLEIAGMKGFEKRDPATLSGGQRSRISLLRSLLAEPEAILLDEPFSNLDKELRKHMRGFVKEQIRRMNIPSILVTHDIEDSIEGEIIELT